MSSNNTGGQFGDTTYTKVFVGGLAWETQKETMKKYFEQFGEILEAVVIIEKNTGRSKGYGFAYYSTVSGGPGSQYLVYAAAENGNGAAANSANLYPYWQYGQGFDYQYPLHYPFIASSSAHLPQHHAPPPISFNAIPHSQPGAIVTTAPAAPSVHALAPHYPAQTNSLHPISNI